VTGYDPLCNLVKDNAEKITNIDWSVYGKILSITKASAAASPVQKINYGYDASGNRISKIVNKQGAAANEYTWYVRDASGNVMSVYNFTGNNLTNGTLNVTEQHLYGSSRLGILNTTIDADATTTGTNANLVGPTYLSNFNRGNKYYEMVNHLGSVLSTISDKKIGHDAGNGTIDFFTADVVTAGDYTPFGMAMVNRKYTQQNAKFRFGFGGQEKSDDIKGEGNSYTAEFWEYDPRIGRRWNVDPKPNLSISLYATFNNNPIFLIDPLGDTTKYFNITSGVELGTINNAGAMSRVKTNAKAYDLLQNHIKEKKINLNNQTEANYIVNSFNGILDKLEASGFLGDLISRETGVKNLTFTGTYNDKTNLASGTLSLNSQFDNGSSLSINQWEALSGTVGKGGKVLWPLPNRGDYVGTGIEGRSAKGFVNHGIGFVLMITDFPVTSTWNRGLFRIHPDGNSPGSAGCVALQSGKDGLLLFKSLMQNYTRLHGNINLSVNLQGNPDVKYLKENEKGKKKINYGE
jgi:RHS repeat-associated protein